MTEQQRVVLATPPVGGALKKLEAWAQALIDSMRPECVTGG